MSKFSTVLVCAIVLGAGFMTVNAQTAAPQAAGKDMRRGEHKFLERFAEHNLAEIHAGKLAAVQGSSREIKNFGKLMEQDHGKSYQEVVQLAKAKRVSLPGQPDLGHKKDAEKMQKLTGAEFDRTYVSSMIKDHEKNVKAFQKMSRGAKDRDVKAFAIKTLPVLEGRLNMARELLGGTKKAG